LPSSGDKDAFCPPFADHRQEIPGDSELAVLMLLPRLGAKSRIRR